MQTWHKRLLHCSYDRILEMAKATRGIKISNPESKEEDYPCPTCIKAKSKKKISRQPQRRSYKPWEFVYLDAVGKLYPTGLWGEEWQITSTDDCTRLIKGNCVASKKGAQAFVKELFRFVETQYGVKIKCLRIDQGYEFGGQALIDFCKLNGCELEVTDAYNPHQNGVAEATNQKINDAIRVATIDYDLEEALWPLLYDGVVHVLNRMTCRGLLAITPLEAANRSLNAMEFAQPHVDYLRPLGCRAYIHIEKEQHVKSHKFESRRDIGVLVGFAGTHQYRVYIPRRKQVITTASVKFDVRPPSFWDTDPALGGDPLSTLGNLEVVEEDTVMEDISNDEVEVGGDSRVNIDPQSTEEDTIIVETIHDQEHAQDQAVARKDYKSARAKAAFKKRKMKQIMQRRVTPKRHKVTRDSAPKGPKTADFTNMPERPKRTKNSHAEEA
jgi:transposase InsO family protein